ncbi:Tn3 family transposase [Streptomyces pinistramenti]|uniref:Tn3 family transposase n=1 Tax=Streptomyces pinistramenti TaxID=2884812 RepID=UPI001D08AA90|nr:Tn3 family transposase [Streptomyces pinistramenti]MCB5907702.1 Tn3 family transposase [Streptomyces pinistramenti]
MKLYRPVAGQPDACPQLIPALPRPIRWELIAQQYHQMIKYATAIVARRGLPPPFRSCVRPYG